MRNTGSRKSTPTGPAPDLGPEVRPGVPRMLRPAAPAPGAHWVCPERQGGSASAAAGRRGLAAVFGTAQPARGLSGAMRSAAYRLPEHRAGRWLLLLAADRVDVLEHRLVRGIWVVPAALGLAVGYAVVSRALDRR